MPTPSAQAIGRALATLGRATSAADGEHEGAPTSREAIFELLERSDGPLATDAICDALGLHPNTVRAHLEVLQAATRVAREADAPHGRGRPRWLYRVAPGARSPRAELADTLLDELGGSHDADLTAAAAQRWAVAADPERRRRPPARSPDDAVSDAADDLTALGFDTRVDSVGDRIELRRCPYAELVAERPVICDIHSALLGELLRDSGQPVTLRRLDVWTRPGLCVAHLERWDLTPARSVRPGRAPSSSPEPRSPSA